MSAANAPKSSVTPTTTSHLPAWLDESTPGSSAAPAAGSFATVEPPRSTGPSVYDALPGYATARTTYRPTAAQLARDELRLAYWRRNVRLPILIATLIVVVLLVVLFLLGFAGPWLGFDPAAARSLIAGLAGLTVILIALPLTALMGILPLAYAAWWFNRRQKRKEFPETGPMAYRSRVQTVLWQLDSLLDRVEAGADHAGDRATRPLIGLHARAAQWGQFAHSLRRNFRRDLSK